MGSRVTSGVLSGAILSLSVVSSWAGECRPDLLEWRGDGGSARFTVELAETSEARSRGLMYRESLPRSEGMLFVYPSPQHASFWMKNTLIPLDMIFADAAGRVTVVHSNAIPGDETPIDGGDGVQFVLEINGGLAKRMGIAPGSELRHPAIDQAQAAWPCTE